MKKKTSEGLIWAEGKTGCIFEMSDDVQAHAHVHNRKTKSAFSSRYFQYGLNNIIDADNFFFFKIITNVMLQIFSGNLLTTKHYLLPGSILTNPYEPTPKVALELRVPETSRLFDRLLPVKHTHVPTDSL